MISASVIIPTFRENDNLTPLITRLYDAFDSESSGIRPDSVQVIVVDDNSPDDTFATIETLSRKYSTLEIVVRKKERGLSSAVIEGFRRATGRVLICMDADLQHPPESVPAMIKAISFEGSNDRLMNSTVPPNFVIGTRYSSEDSSTDKDWPLYRRIISAGARLLARPLTPMSDPMTGFFGLTRDAFIIAQKHGINPIGFKIALELFVKAGVSHHAEIPIRFGVRLAGESKLSSKVIIGYLKHLAELYMYKMPWALIVLALVICLPLILLIKQLDYYNNK